MFAICSRSMIGRYFNMLKYYCNVKYSIELISCRFENLLRISRVRLLHSSPSSAKKLIKAANSKTKTRIDNIQYRLVISELITFLFFPPFRSSLERWYAEESEMYKPTTIVSSKGKEKKKQEIEERQVQSEYSGINVKYPL